MIPWVEMNSASHLDTVRTGIAAWGTDRVLVSTVPGLESLLGQLSGSQIVPGVKARACFCDQGRGIDSVNGWREYAICVERARCETDGRIVLLEMETAVRDYIHGNQALDMDGVRAGLHSLPAGIEYWWYPSASRNAEYMDRYAALCRLVAEVHPAARFVDTVSLAFPTDAGTEASQRVAESLAGLSRIPLIYAIPREMFWPVADAPIIEDSIIYTGLDNWVDVAREMSRRM